MNSESIGIHDRKHMSIQPSQLFLLRVWLDEESGENELQGKLQHAVTGQARNFASFADLRDLILEIMLSAKNARKNLP